MQFGKKTNTLWAIDNIRNASIIRLKHQNFVLELTLKVPLVSGLFRRVKVNDAIVLISNV